MTTRAHTTEPELLDLLLGRLPAAEAGTLRAHLSTCADCAGILRSAERLLAAAAEDLAEPPAAALGRARAVLRTEWRPGAAARVREILARLLPGPVPAPAFTRSVAGAAAPAVYEAGPWLVEVAEERGAPRRRSLRLRVVEAATGHPAAGLARFSRAGRVVAEAAVDDLGEAVLPDLPRARGEVSILVLGDRLTLTI
jgi:hypothetical protein